MTNTDILLEDLEDVLDDATSMPMTKKSLVDVEKIKTIIEDIRLNTPQKQSRQRLLLIQETALSKRLKRKPPILSLRLRSRLASLLHAIKSPKPLRPKLRISPPRQRKRARLMFATLKIRQRKFSAMPQHRQTRW